MMVINQIWEAIPALNAQESIVLTAIKVEYVLLTLLVIICSIYLTLLVTNAISVTLMVAETVSSRIDVRDATKLLIKLTLLEQNALIVRLITVNSVLMMESVNNVLLDSNQMLMENVCLLVISTNAILVINLVTALLAIMARSQVQMDLCVFSLAMSMDVFNVHPFLMFAVLVLMDIS